MLYATTQARMKTVEKIDDLMEKIGSIHSSVMSSEDVRTMRFILNNFRSEIIKEDAKK